MKSILPTMLICLCTCLLVSQAAISQQSPKTKVSSSDIKRHSDHKMQNDRHDASDQNKTTHENETKDKMGNFQMQEHTTSTDESSSNIQKKSKLKTDGIVGPKTMEKTNKKSSNYQKKHLGTISHEQAGNQKKKSKKDQH